MFQNQPHIARHIHCILSIKDLMQRKKYIFFFLYRQYINKKHLQFEIFQKFPLNPIK